jgi:hypothetical protein
MRFRGVRGMYTCDWQTSTFIPDLEDNMIDAVLCISKNKKPQVTLDTYTCRNIQHYSASIDNLVDEKLEAEALRMSKIIHHFVSQGGRILITTSEECAVAFAIIFYTIWSYYHNGDGTRKDKVRKPEVSIATQTIQELKSKGIETDLLQTMVQRLYRLEDKYAGIVI